MVRYIFLCIAAPEYEHDVFAPCREGTYSRIGKLLPAAALVTARLMCPHGERGVEQQHALLCPSHKASTLRRGLSEVAAYLAEDIYERRREPYSVVHREAKPVCLSRLMIRVLTDNHRLYLVERAQVEGIEDKFPGRVTRAGGILRAYKSRKGCKVGFVKLCGKLRVPRRLNPDIHGLKCLYETSKHQEQ